MSDYQVKYLITVNSEKAIEGINAFKTAIGSLNKSAASIENVRRQFVSIYDTMVGLTRKPLNLTITANTREAVTQLEVLQRQAISTISTLERLQQVAAQPVRMRTTGGGKGGKNTTAPIGGSVKASQQTVAQTPTNPKYVTPSRRGGNVPTAHEQRTQFSGNRLGAFYSALDGRKLSSSELKAAYSGHSRIGTASAAERSMQKFFRNVAGTSAIHGSTPTQQAAWGMYRDHMRNIAATNPGKLWAQQANVPRLYPQSMELQNLRAQYAAMERMTSQQIAQERKQWRDLRRSRGPVTHPKYRTNTYGGVPAWKAAEYAASQRAAMYPPWAMPRSYSQMLPANQLVAPAGIPSNYRGGRMPSSSNGGRYATRGSRGSGWGGRFYKLFGPTPLPNNGGMAIDMLKGMGIAYGIAGVGSLVSEIVDQSVEYGNLIQTVENILKSHDNKGNFDGRFQGMTRVVRNVGMKTKYTVTEVADAAKFLAMAGLDVEQITKAIQPIADIALIGDTDLGTTADLVTNIMTSYKIPAERMRWAADVMTNTFTRSNVTLPEIAESMRYFAPIAKAALLPFEEVAAAVGVLGDAGLKGSIAGTSLRRITQNLVAPRGKKRQKAWESVGVDRFDAYGYLRPLTEIFKDLGAKNLKAEEYFGLFDVTASQAAVALAQNADKLAWLSDENALSGGLAARLAEKKTNTMKGLWAQVKSVFIDRGVSAYSGVEGQVQYLMRSALDYMGANDTEGNTQKGDHFKAKMHELANTVMEFVNAVIDASKWFLHFYQLFAPMIKIWAKFQLMIWPIVKAITAFASVFRVLFTVSLLSKARTWVAAFDLITAATERNTTALLKNAAANSTAAKAPVPGSVRYHGWGLRRQVWMPERGGVSRMTMNPITGRYESYTTPVLPAGWVGTNESGWGIGWQSVKNGVKGLFTNPSGSLKRYTPYITNRWGRKALMGRIGRGTYSLAGSPVMGMVGAAVGSYKAMQQATDDEGSGWAAGLYGAGAVASMFGPWGMAAGAVLMAAGAVTEYIHNCNLAKEAAKQLGEANKAWMVTEDGRLINSKGSKLSQYWDLIISKQTDYGSILQANIDRLKEQYNLIENPPFEENTGSMEAFNDIWNRLDKDSGGHQKTQQRSDVARWLAPLGLSLSDLWGFTKDGKTKYIQSGQQRGWLAATTEALTGTSSEAYYESWMSRISSAIQHGDDLSTVFEEFNKAVPNYTMDQLMANLPQNDTQWKAYLDNPEKLWSLPIMQYLRHKAVNNRMSADGTSWQNIVDADTAWKNALANNGDIMGAYAGIHKYVKDKGMIVSDYTNLEDWTKSQLGWDGTGYIGSNGKPMEFSDLAARLAMLDEEWEFARTKGLQNHLDNQAVKTYLDNLDEQRKKLSAYIYGSYPTEAESANLFAPENPYSFTNPYLKRIDENWYTFNPTTKNKEAFVPVTPVSPTNNNVNPFSLWNPFSTYNVWDFNNPYQWQYPLPDIPSTNSGWRVPMLLPSQQSANMWTPSAVNWGTATPSESASQMVAQAQIKPEFHFHINGSLMNVENQTISNPNNQEVPALIAQVLGGATSAEGLQRLGSGNYRS